MSKIIESIAKLKLNKVQKVIDELKVIYPLPDFLLVEMYNKCVSIHQCSNQSNGEFLESTIISELSDHGVPFKKQVVINKDGVIVGERKSKCYHIVDFVIGDNIEIGKSITEYKVVSCKTTCRERWTQDDWTFTYCPLKYILLTISNDYPSSQRFREDENRKIITCHPKKTDDRKHKLDFQHLIEELRS